MAYQQTPILSQPSKHQSYALDDPEEGQIDYLDNNPYIVDPSFSFRIDPFHKVNWRNINSLNLKTLKTASFSEINSLLRQNLQDIALCDLKEEQRCVWISHEGINAMRVLQMGMQYLMHQQHTMYNCTVAKEEQALHHKKYVERLEDKLREVKSKTKRYEMLQASLEEQAVHFEIMLNKISPAILKERFTILRDKDREELLKDHATVFSRILKEKGILSDFQVNGGIQSPIDMEFERENSNPNRTYIPSITPPQESGQQLELLKELMDNVKKLQEQLDEIKQTRQHVQFQATPQTLQGVNASQGSFQDINQRQSLAKPDSKNSTFSFNHQPVFSNTLGKHELQQTLGQTSKNMLESEYQEDFENNDGPNSNPSSSLDERIQIATNLPVIPQETNSLSRASSSVKSYDNTEPIKITPRSQNNEGDYKTEPGSRKKWDIAPTSKTAAVSQEIEQIIQSNYSSAEAVSSTNDLKVSGQSSNRPDSQRKLKHQDAIKEEAPDAEESEFEDPNAKRKVIEQSASASEDIYEDDFLKSSGLVQESLEKKTPSPSKTNKPGGDPLNKFNSPISPGLQKKSPSAVGLKPSDRKDTESILEDEVPIDEEEYNEDEFEQESQKSNKIMQGTLSQSGLPPLASGKVNAQTKIAVEDASDYSGVKQPVNARPNRLPTDFNLNIAESQGSLDFDISDSKNTFLGQYTMTNNTVQEKPVQRRSTYVEMMKKKIDEQDESQEYIDSGDFHLSESNFSQSFRSKAPSITKSGQKSAAAEKKPFYFYEQQKFSSYQTSGGNKGGASGNNPNDLDDEF